MNRLVPIALLACACGRYGFPSVPDGDVDARETSDAPDAASTCTFILGAGRQHLAAVFPDGTARVWGDGQYGQIGDGMNLDRTSPVSVSLPASVVSAGAGRYETCAVLATGVVYCWGEGDSGQLGDGAGVTRPTPAPVANLTGAVEVAPAAFHVCARRAGGEVWCWGAGGSGRLGRGSTTSSNVPVQTINLPAVKRVTSGGSTSCAIVDADDSPRCWGYNVQGGVGVNSTTDVLSPMQPIGLDAVRAIISRDLSTCAVRDDGAVFCWGSNTVGQCGTGTGTGDLLVPTPVRIGNATLGDAIDVGLGIDHGCALLANGQVWCWGRNQFGQLGNGVTGTGTQDFATLVPGLPELVHIGIAAWTTCGLDREGNVWCWGLGNDGQLGDGTPTANTPTPKISFTPCPSG